MARALVHNPRLVVCDEPTSALDHQTGKRVMEALRSLAVSQDRALIIVTHDARIFEFADRIASMDDGRIVNIKANNGHQEDVEQIIYEHSLIYDQRKTKNPKRGS